MTLTTSRVSASKKGPSRAPARQSAHGNSQYLGSLVAVATVAYGGLRHAAAHSARAQADAWRIVLAGVGGLVIALLAPTIVSIVQGLIPS